MQIKINSLKIRNFKSIRKLDLEFGGKSAEITGENGTGKTTVSDAWAWVMSDSNSDHRSNFNIISLGSDGQQVKGLDASVEAIVCFGSKLIELKKIYKQILKGEEIIGHTTDHYINDEKVAKKDYMTEIDNEVFRSLSFPGYFCGSTAPKWRRQTLIDMVDIMSTDEILAIDDNFAPIVEPLKTHSSSGYRGILLREKKDLSKQIEKIPAIIEGLKQAIGEVEPVDSKEIEDLEKKIFESGADRRKKRLLLLESELLDLTKLGRQQGDFKRQLDNVIAEREILGRAWKDCNRSKYKKSSICFTCGQDLPDDKIEDQKIEFEKERKKNLKDIEKEGMILKSQIERLNKKIDDSIEDKKRAVISQIHDVKNEDVDDSLELKLNDLKKKMLEAEIAKKNEDMIIERKRELKQLSCDLETVEHRLYLLSEFDRYRAEETEKVINDKFDGISWRLFETLKNGNLKEVCEPLIDGIPFNTDLNTGAKINAGINCIKALSENCAIKFPIFIDNSESVTSFNEFDGQLIKLRAVKDQELRLEA